ncbi:MAG: dolichyl-phosphate beta-glucosyltransferase [Methanoregulaceae archaeon]
MIIPVYNDRESLMRAIPISLEVLSRVTDQFELIIAEDGSTDGSTEFARDYAMRDTRVCLLHNDARQGRGKALNNAIRAATGDIVGYFDVDLATDTEHLKELVSSIEAGYDIATGSRLMPDSDIVRSGKREIASRSYNFLVRLILRSKLRDHQCGFKAFNRNKILPLLPKTQSNHWFWDTEILVRGQKEGFSIREFPVRWRQGKGTTVQRRDITEMGTAILKLWWQIHVSEN